MYFFRVTLVAVNESLVEKYGTNEGVHYQLVHDKVKTTNYLEIEQCPHLDFQN